MFNLFLFLQKSGGGGGGLKPPSPSLCAVPGLDGNFFISLVNFNIMFAVTADSKSELTTIIQIFPYSPLHRARRKTKKPFFHRKYNKHSKSV